jgi:hypothetical protein
LGFSGIVLIIGANILIKNRALWILQASEGNKSWLTVLINI